MVSNYVRGVVLPAVCGCLVTRLAIFMLGAFAKLRKARSCPSVLPSVHMELGSHRSDFHEILYLRIFRKSVEKIQVSLKSDKNNGYFTWRPMCSHDSLSVISSFKKISPITGPRWPESSRKLSFPHYLTMAQDGGQPYSPAAFTPRKYSWYSFLLEAESTPGLWCVQKDYINEKFQWHQVESNQGRSDL